MIDLQKGQRVKVELPKFTIGLGWDTNSSNTGVDFDLDASAFILGENKKLLSDEHFVFFNNLQSPDGAVVHTGDNLTGEGEGDDETILIDLSKISPNASEIVFVVTIHKADERNQNFGQVHNSLIRVFNTDTNEEIMKYELEEDFSIETAVEFGRLYRHNDQWKFEAIGVGMKGGLADYLKKYQ
ncbi:TerD family protein [uncultured Alloprevotella sp.]|jgi:tellurium resistance protein terD|uniref:TerD family protein n=1 Tax=uncultured Alloprevotella sp. TaxID=1283315 RepID=UPI00325FA640